MTPHKVVSIAILIFGVLAWIKPPVSADQSSSATVTGLAVPQAPSLIRREGSVLTHDRQDYQLEFRDAMGAKQTIRYNNQMRAYLRGHAIPWVDVKAGDSLIILETDAPLQTIVGSRVSEESSGTVEAVDRKRQTFYLRNSQGRLEEFINTPGIRIDRRRAQVSYLDTAPGDSVTVRY